MKGEQKFPEILRTVPSNNLDNTQQEQLRKLLCTHYGIEYTPSQFSELALALAIEFVPAFKKRKKRGAKQKWDVTARALLRFEVNRLLGKSHSFQKKPRSAHSSDDPQLRSVIDELASSASWKSILRSTSRDPAALLLKQYYLSRNETRVLEEIEEFYDLHRTLGYLDDWDLFVAYHLAK